MKTLLPTLLFVIAACLGCNSAPRRVVAPYTDVPISHTNRFSLARAPFVSLGEAVQNDLTRRQKLAESFILNRDSEDRIVGFRVSVQEEPEWFSKLGLQEEDTLLKINAMRITTRPRLEWFPQAFMKNEANVFVLDLDRNGERVRQLYVFK